MVKFTNQYYVEYTLKNTVIIKATSLKDLASKLTGYYSPTYIYTPAELRIAYRRAYKYTVTDGRMYLKDSVISPIWIVAFSKSERWKAKKRADRVRAMRKACKKRKK